MLCVNAFGVITPSKISFTYTMLISLDSLSELLECQLEIASDKDILHQVSCVAVAPEFESSTSQDIAALFSNLATHKYIAESVYVGRLLKACEMFKLMEPENALLE